MEMTQGRDLFPRQRRSGYPRHLR